MKNVGGWRLVGWFRLAGAILVSVMAVLSVFRYTTAGLDFEVPTDDAVDTYYYRLRWDDASTWVGLAVQPVPRPDRPLDWFDPGGTLLAEPTRPDPRSWANRLGFWRVDGPGDDPYVARRYPGARVSRWWAVPSWLVLMVVWGRPLVRRLRRRRAVPIEPVARIS